MVYILQVISSFVSLVSTLGRGHISLEPPCLWSQRSEAISEQKEGFPAGYWEQGDDLWPLREGEQVAWPVLPSGDLVLGHPCWEPQETQLCVGAWQ